MTIENIRHCLNVMVECEVCEECNLYGTTGTDHCEHDCVCGALDIIDRYQKIENIVDAYVTDNPREPMYDIEDYMQSIREVIEDDRT